MGQIEKVVSFTERGSLTENNGTITNHQLLMVREKFNFFENFKNSQMGGGARRKTEKFWQIEKIIGDLYELDNSKKKIFKIEIANVIVRPILSKSENIFRSIAQI